MTMITIQKLPSLEPEMRTALRKHIMRKRQILKQEMEQDAIEKRLKREREQKRLQDAMTLDQIKEQLSALEKRLETLKREKNDLFVHLKQVLNEGSVKRKQNETVCTPATSQKKVKLEQERDSKSVPAPVNDDGPNNNKQSISNANNEQSVKPDPYVPPQKPEEPTRQLNAQSPKQLTSLPIRPPANTIFESRIANHPVGQMSQTVSMMNQPVSMMSLPPILNHSHTNIGAHKFSESPTSFPRRESLATIPPSASMTQQNLASFQAQFRHPFGPNEGLPSIPPELFMMSQRLNTNFQKLPSHVPDRLPLGAFPMSLSSSLPSQHDMLANAKSHTPGLNLLTSQRVDDTLPTLNKSQTSSLPPSYSVHPNQFIADNMLPPHLTHLSLLNHGISLANLDAPTSVASFPGLGQNMIPPSFHPRGTLPHQLSRNNLDYLGPTGQQLRSNLLLPGLNPLYPPHSSPSIQPSTSLYQSAYLNHQLFQASLAQRMSGPMAPFSLTPQQQQLLQQSQLEQASRIFASNSGNYHRRSSPKNQYYPNR